MLYQPRPRCPHAVVAQLSVCLEKGLNDRHLLLPTGPLQLQVPTQRFEVSLERRSGVPCLLDILLPLRAGSFSLGKIGVALPDPSQRAPRAFELGGRRVGVLQLKRRFQQPLRFEVDVLQAPSSRASGGIHLHGRSGSELPAFELKLALDLGRRGRCTRRRGPPRPSHDGAEIGPRLSGFRREHGCCIGGRELRLLGPAANQRRERARRVAVRLVDGDPAVLVAVPPTPQRAQHEVAEGWPGSTRQGASELATLCSSEDGHPLRLLCRRLDQQQRLQALCKRGTGAGPPAEAGIEQDDRLVTRALGQPTEELSLRHAPGKEPAGRLLSIHPYEDAVILRPRRRPVPDEHEPQRSSSAHLPRHGASVVFDLLDRGLLVAQEHDPVEWYLPGRGQPDMPVVGVLDGPGNVGHEDIILDPDDQRRVSCPAPAGRGGPAQVGPHRGHGEARGEGQQEWRADHRCLDTDGDSAVDGL